MGIPSLNSSDPAGETIGTTGLFQESKKYPEFILNRRKKKQNCLTETTDEILKTSIDDENKFSE